MATVSFTVDTTFLTRMRTAILKERPDLAGQTTAVINEAARQKIRTLARDWIYNSERSQAAVTATNSVVYPTDADIT